MLDWNDLRYLLAVARAGSTLAAAKALGTSQSTVHRRLTHIGRADWPTLGEAPKLLQGSRLCRMARVGSEANLDRGPHHPRQNIEAGQSLPARPVRAGGMGRSCKSETDQMARPRAQALDRGRQEAAAPQRARHRPCQQTRAHRVERSCPWSSLSRRTSVRLLRDRSRVIELPAAEVCERMRRDGGSVFPAPVASPDRGDHGAGDDRSDAGDAHQAFASGVPFGQLLDLAR